LVPSHSICLKLLQKLHTQYNGPNDTPFGEMVYILNSNQLGLLQHPSFVYSGGLTDIIIIGSKPNVILNQG
jgi:hypothetical protein